MGNWMTVSMRGSLAREDVAAVREFIRQKPDYSNFHCLTAATGLAGLGMWAAEEIHADGNLAERDYGFDSVAETLREIVAIAPSLSLKVHCGGDYESTECVATVTVEQGTVTVGPPEREEVRGVDSDVMMGRLFRVLHGGSDV